MRSVVLIDGKNFAYRHHYTHRQLSHNGFPTSILFGCLSGLLSIAKRLPDVPLVWVWDGDGKTWRHKLASSFYKSQRVALNLQHSDDIDAVHLQLPLLKKFLVGQGLRSFEVKGLEGDDLIGILAHEILRKQLFNEVIILSSDKDFYQFIGPQIKVLKGVRKGRLDWADKKEIRQAYGIPVSKWAQFRAIMGDKSDNIPQIFAGVGPKTAANFILNGIDVTAATCDVVAVVRKKEVNFGANWQRIQLNYKLCQIPTVWDYPEFASDVKLQLKEMVNNLKRRSFYRSAAKREDEDTYQKMLKFFHRYELISLIERRHELWKLP